MPIQMPQWTEFLSCPICFNMFNEVQYRPISLACGHTVCKACLCKLQQKKCPFDQNPINRDVNELPVNFALLQLVGVAVPDIQEGVPADSLAENLTYYNSGKKCIEELAIFLKPIPSDPAVAGGSSSSGSMLSRPMQRKLVTLVNCQLVEEEGRMRAMRAARSLGERTVTELILQHQNSQQLSANLWAAVRARGCQFLGPGMQEEVLRLILLALEDGSALSRKVLVLFVVQRLEAQYPQASKTAIGHVVQLLYRASCFKVTKREEESSLMQLKEEFCTYEALRREHDAQIVQIATEAGLRISPEQWSSLLYGDTAHKSHMQSIIDKLQTPQSFSQGVHELVLALQRTGDPGNLSRLRPHLDLLSSIDPSPDAPSPSWENLEAVMKAIKTVVQGLVEFIQSNAVRKSEPTQANNLKYRTSMCRDLIQKGSCPRGPNCTFAHSQDEMEKFRVRKKKFQRPAAVVAPVLKPPTSSALTPKEKAALSAVSKSAEAKLMDRAATNTTPILAQAAAPDVVTRIPLSEHSEKSHSPISFKVPVAKAMSLPMYHKHAENRKMIYTSPTVARSSQHPGIVPIAKRAAAYNMQMVIENPYLNHLPQDLGHSSNTTMRSGMGSPPHHDTMPQANSLAQYQISSHTNEPTKNQESYHSSMEGELEMMTMPQSSYPNDHYELYSSSRSKSPSQHLEILQRRKNELLHQLNKSQRSSIRRKLSETEQSENTAVNTQMMTCQCTVIHTNTVAISSPSIAKHSSANSTLHAVNVVKMSQAVEPHAMVAEQPMVSFQSNVLQQSLGDISGSPMAESGRLIPNQSSMSWTIRDSTYMSSTGERFQEPRSRHHTVYDESSIPPEDGDEEFNDSAVLSNPLDSILPVDDFESQDPADIFYIGGPIDEEIVYDDEGNISASADDDEFIPFEHTTVSKYGPISRMARPSQTKNTAPLQVTASQQKRDAIPVTAITPIRRPYPVFMEMPSQFAPGPNVEGHSLDHHPDPRGYGVAASLPTAHIRPSLLMAGSLSERQTMWSLKERMLNMPGSNLKPAANSTAEREQIRHELAQLTKQIDHLEVSEHKRLARELQAVEMNIQETERKMEIQAVEDYLVAQKQQELEVAQAKEKLEQEANDRLMAQRLALEEAHKGLQYIGRENVP